MTRLGPRSRVLLSACAYLLVVTSMTGGAFFTTLALVPGASAHGERAAVANPQMPGRKIGPGYARMRPIDLGKPEKVVYSSSYRPHVMAPMSARAKKHTAPTITAECSAPTTAPPIKIAAAVQSSYSLADIHSIY
jgi:hypothetical protein